NAFAAAMSSSCSEKNNSVIEPVPSLQSARSGQSGSRTSPVSMFVGWMANIADHSPFCLFYVRLRWVVFLLWSIGAFLRWLSGKEKGRRVAPTALRRFPCSCCYGWETSWRRGRPCLSVVVPSEIGDQNDGTVETGHGWYARTRALPAMPLAAAAAYIPVIVRWP